MGKNLLLLGFYQKEHRKRISDAPIKIFILYSDEFFVTIRKTFLKALKRAKDVLISTHIFPDADGVGSQIALCLALRSKGINALCVNEGALSERYRHLDTDNVVLSRKKFNELYGKTFSADLFIVVDANSLLRLGTETEKIGKRSKNILFIDHHPCPKEIAAVHCIDPSKAATGEIISGLIDALKVKPTKEMSLALYTAILIDTNCFRYPSVTSHTHRIVSKCMKTGIKPELAYQKLYGTKKIEHIQLLGKILGGVKSTKDKKIAWLTITEQMFDRYNASFEDTHSFVNYLLVLNRVQVACIFRQMGGKVKLSLRSAGNIDVGVIAQALGGGGHHHSAASLIEGSPRKVIGETIKKIRSMIS